MAVKIIAHNEAKLNQKSHLENLLEEVSKIALPESRPKRGRPYLYSPQQVIAAFVVMLYRNLDSFSSLARVLEGERNLSIACGFKKKTPCWKTFLRRFRTLDNDIANTAKAIASRLILSKAISKEKVGVDSTVLKAKGTPAQKNYPKIVPTDSDASWGYSESKGFIFGYKLHLTSTVGEVIAPLSFEVTGANVHDSTQFKALTKNFNKTKHFVGDNAYDSKELYQFASSLGGKLTTPVRRFRNLNEERKALVSWYESDFGQYLYARRSDIERLFGTLKDVFLIDPLPVTGAKAVKTYISLAIVAYLSGIYYNCLAGRPPRAIKSIAR